MDTQSALNHKEWLEISSSLEEYHVLFYKLWQLGEPVFTDRIPTAAVSFDKQGEYVQFKFNPDFWKEITAYERLFVIAHECLHVILNHGIRTLHCKDKFIANQCLDIVVNHLLIKSFGFDRKKLNILGKPNGNALCWVDTVFDTPEPDNETFEYYYSKVPKSDAEILDCHDWGNFDKLIDEIKKDISPEELQSALPALGMHAGIESGRWEEIAKKKTVKKKKWETIIKDWVKNHTKLDLVNKEQWSRVNRRFGLLTGKLHLPTEIEDDNKKKDRIPVFLFMDTSGSCWNMKDRFISAALSIPQENFLLRTFFFDTCVAECELNSPNNIKIYGGGGTSFAIIESKIQELILKEKIQYPEVFVITDGWGTHVYPQFPKKWHWILTQYSSTVYLPKDSNTYNLTNFE